MPLDAVVAQIRDNKWRQGQVVRTELNQEVAGLAGLEIDDAALCIIVSQSCNLVHHDLEAEPVVEIVVGRPTEKPDGRLKFARNPRCLHLQVMIGGASKYFEIHAKDRRVIPRGMLAKSSPSADATLGAGELRVLLDWIWGRYQRTAFPDAFQKRLGAVQEKLRKKAAKLLDIEGLYVSLSTWGELEAGQVYTVALLAHVVEAAWDDPERRSAAAAAVDEFVETLASADGIAVDREMTEKKPSSSITLAELEETRRWCDFDYVSLADQAGHQQQGAG